MYEFYMAGVRLPVTPSSLTIKTTNQNKTINLINDSQLNIIKTPGLSKYSFNALLPNRQYPFASYPDGYQPAQYYMSLLEKLKYECKPFEFVVIRTDDAGELLMANNPDQLLMVSLESYELSEDVTSYGLDVMAKIELLTYNDVKTKLIEFKQSDGSTKTATVTQQRDTTTAPNNKTYTVKSGDTLWDIARVQLGNGTKWPSIYNLNKATIEAAAKKYGRDSSSNGWWIYPGTVLKLPS